jgi:hypothetical protein
VVLQIARMCTVSQSMVRRTCRFPIKNLSMTKSMTFSQIKIDKSKKKLQYKLSCNSDDTRLSYNVAFSKKENVDRKIKGEFEKTPVRGWARWQIGPMMEVEVVMNLALKSTFLVRFSFLCFSLLSFRYFVLNLLWWSWICCLFGRKLNL